MDQISREDLSQYNEIWLEIKEFGPLSAKPMRHSFKRDDNLTLTLEATHDGWVNGRNDNIPEGTFTENDESIIFESHWGVKATARGVILRGSSSHGRSGRRETTEKCTIHQLDIRYPNSSTEIYSVEWLCNIPNGMHWPSNVENKEITNATRILKWAEGDITMLYHREKEGFARASLHIEVLGYDFILVSDIRKEDENLRMGYLVCRGTPTKDIRAKILDVISFTLGRPIISLGYTTYSKDWAVVFSTSVSPFTNDQRYFKLHTLPPYPIVSQGTRNSLDQVLIKRIVENLVDNYDKLQFQYLAWAYWHAMCAPYHIEAAHLGALIETLQKRVDNTLLGKEGRSILPRTTWRELRKKIIPIIEAEDLPEETYALIARQVCDSNRKPQRQVLSSICGAIGVTVDELEMSAWNQRNDAAHGNVSENYVNILLNGKALRILFHRMIAGITECSTHYNDYYSFRFPVRLVGQPLPRRSDHPSKARSGAGSKS